MPEGPVPAETTQRPQPGIVEQTLAVAAAWAAVAPLLACAPFFLAPPLWIAAFGSIPGGPAPSRATPRYD